MGLVHASERVQTHRYIPEQGAAIFHDTVIRPDRTAESITLVHCFASRPALYGVAVDGRPTSVHELRFHHLSISPDGSTYDRTLSRFLGDGGEISVPQSFAPLVQTDAAQLVLPRDFEQGAQWIYQDGTGSVSAHVTEVTSSNVAASPEGPAGKVVRITREWTAQTGTDPRFGDVQHMTTQQTYREGEGLLSQRRVVNDSAFEERLVATLDQPGGIDAIVERVNLSDSQVGLLQLALRNIGLLDGASER